MGYYINTPKQQDKAQQLIDLHKAIKIPKPKSFYEVPVDKALICVVSNPMFDAAALCYSEDEFFTFSYPLDTRPKSWLLMDKAEAHSLSNYHER